MTLRATMVAVAVASLLTMPLTAQQAPRLGTIAFPTSGPPGAQAQFEQGVLFLHSFEYGSAAQAFRRAQELAPRFVLAYWGEAMTYNHPIWDERDRDAAHAALQRLAPTRAARLALAPTERERMYLDAVETLWEEGAKADRDTAYSLAMERLAERFPDDIEARAFYALSLIGLSSGTRVFSTYMRAAAIAEEIYAAHPTHPGAVHYLIHAYDDPVHAPLGLRVARAYSKIAPDAAHAQHMTTHIFLAMGMWPEVVSQNEIAAGLTHWGPGHYTYWLAYGLEQLGRWRDARARLDTARTLLAERPTAGRRSYFAYMRADYVVNTEDWTGDVAGWSVDLSDAWPAARAADAFVTGMRGLETGNAGAVTGALARLDDASAPRPAATVAMALELRAMVALRHGDAAEAERLLREAAAIEDTMAIEFGPPSVVKPSWELLGEMLLQQNRAADAQHAFQRALALAPDRLLALRGLARAATKAGDAAVAGRTWAKLLEQLREADPGLPLLAEARRYAGR